MTLVFRLPFGVKIGLKKTKKEDDERINSFSCPECERLMYLEDEGEGTIEKNGVCVYLWHCPSCRCTVEEVEKNPPDSIWVENKEGYIEFERE